MGTHAYSDRASVVAAGRRTVLFVEASSGGIVGGSLTGLVHQIYGMPSGWRSVLALYERKSIEADLIEKGVPVYHVGRWRVPKRHALQAYDSYQAARRVGLIRKCLSLARVSARTIAEELPAALSLARIIRCERPAVLHLGNGVRANFDGVMAAWMTRTPCVCHVKGFEKYGARERWAAARVDAVVCMTMAVKRHCESHGVRAPLMRVVYDALDATRFRSQRPREEVRAELGLDPGTCAVGIIGGIQEWKGQGVLIEATALARRAGTRVRSFVVGGVHAAGMAYADRIKARARDLGVENEVVFTGARQDVADLLVGMDIVVHASTRPEPFGRVIMEAMLLGRPVIASAAGGVPEFVDEGRTGYLYSPGDAEALAARMQLLADDRELRERIGRQAQADARQRFAIDRHVQAMTELYESISRSD